MATVTMAVEQDVFDKIDIGFIESQIIDDVVFLFACTNDSEWQNALLETSDGKPLFVIKLSYSKVKRMAKEKVKELMLTKAQERLKQVA